MNRLNELRAEKNFMKQEDLAKIMSVDPSIISRYETSKSKSVNIDFENKLCDYFDCSLDYLRGRSNIKNEAEYSKSLHNMSNIIVNFYSKGPDSNLSAEQISQLETFMLQFKKLFKTLSDSRFH